MAEYHYVVAYNTETNYWSVEDETNYFDGNVWTEDDGWSWPEDGQQAMIDQRCKNMLYSLVPIWPTIDQTEE